jgi:hypothetical protein
MPTEAVLPLTYGGKMTVRFSPATAILGEPYRLQVAVENVGTVDCVYVVRWLRFSRPDAVIEKRLELAVGDSVTYTFRGVWDRPGRRLFDFQLYIDVSGGEKLQMLDTITRAVYVHADRNTLLSAQTRACYSH